jgi:hypothetical protein
MEMDLKAAGIQEPETVSPVEERTAASSQEGRVSE